MLTSQTCRNVFLAINEGVRSLNTLVPYLQVATGLTEKVSRIFRQNMGKGLGTAKYGIDGFCTVAYPECA